MKIKFNSIWDNTKKLFRMIRNILKNASKELLSHHKVNKIVNFIKKYKFYFFIILILILFIFKNIYAINSYNQQIELYSEKIIREKSYNNQLKEDLEYYKTDTYIIKIATEELNLRLTTENKLFHGPIFKEKPEDDVSDDEIIVDSNTNESSTLENDSDDLDSETQNT